MEVQKLKIEVHAGSVIVNGAWIQQDGADVKAVGVDLSTKRAEISYTSDVPEIGLDVGCGSLHGSGVHGVTILRFPTLVGWQIWSADVSRYTVHICFVRSRHEGE